jgi:rSAM/selenodomain-associated transferase 2
MISIIIPTLNEENFILNSIKPLQNLRKKNCCEIIVIDGQSNDSTVNMVHPYVDDIFVTNPKRSLQQNLGASIAKGDILLFLHADTILTEKNLLELNNFHKDCSWGFYLISLGEKIFKYQMLEKCINLRSQIFNYATGDQGIFIRKDLFNRIGGFPNIDLMEDLEICKILKKLSLPYIIKSQIITSSRKWKSDGFLKTVLKMRLFRILNAVGLHPNLLKKYY